MAKPRVEVTSACAMCAAVHTSIASEYPAFAPMVDQPAEEQEPDPVGGLKPEDDVAITCFRPAIELLQRRLQDAED